ncbi:MAG TPA: winged helix-turn-helix transcriptional regulator [Candidatus Thermoplasmatota archaeon]|nr:winged helix-turn-helix transcriptional regulator [Candidatus Thermoplasmatota archaeon]
MHEDILSLDSRRKIYEFVKGNPGAHLREIARSLNLPLGTALYHLDYLTGSDMIVVRRDGRYKRFFVKHMLGRREKDYVSTFHHSVPRKIATVILAKSKHTQRELCAEVGVSRSTLSFHLAQMVEKGLLTVTEGWPENIYHLTEPELAGKVLVMFRETFADEASANFEEMVDLIGASLRESGSLTGPAAAEEDRQDNLGIVATGPSLG